MKGNRAAIAAAVAVVLVIAGWWFTRGGGAEAMALIPLLETADKRPASGTFQVVDADLNGETRRAIFTVPESRIIYKIKVPDDAWLKVAVGMKPESWTQEGDGVLFRVGASDGRTYDPLFEQHVNPFANAGDRKWIPVWVDLSAYAGEEIQLIFNTNNSPKDKGDDDRGDLALWGSPEIVIR
jgi:hypothetical protein